MSGSFAPKKSKRQPRRWGPHYVPAWGSSRKDIWDLYGSTERGFLTIGQCDAVYEVVAKLHCQASYAMRLMRRDSVKAIGVIAENDVATFWLDVLAAQGVFTPTFRTALLESLSRRNAPQDPISIGWGDFANTYHEAVLEGASVWAARMVHILERLANGHVRPNGRGFFDAAGNQTDLAKRFLKLPPDSVEAHREFWRAELSGYWEHLSWHLQKVSKDRFLSVWQDYWSGRLMALVVSLENENAWTDAPVGALVEQEWAAVRASLKERPKAPSSATLVGTNPDRFQGTCEFEGGTGTPVKDCGDEQPDKPDNKPDNGKNSLPKIPESPDVTKLCRLLQKELPTGRSMIDIAREFTGQDDAKAENLLRQARRYRHLFDQPK